MPEITNYNFSLSEITKILLKEQKITEGVWMVGFEFGLGAGLIPASGASDPTEVFPGSVSVIQRVQLVRFSGQGPLPQFAVDASSIS